ncbi:GPW/gp25 family protein [bacterium]|nr:GPW/gp25 family protein [bacterium]
MPISIQFPLVIDRNGFLQFADDQTSDAIDQNLKFMMLTVPGTFFEYPDFGVNIQQYLFEFGNPNTEEAAKANILSQARRFLPYLTILSTDISFEEMSMNIRIQYRIDQTSEVQYFELTTTAA